MKQGVRTGARHVQRVAGLFFIFAKASANMSDALEDYLHDHLAGAGAAIDLLETMSKECAGEPLGQFAGELLVEAESWFRKRFGHIGSARIPGARYPREISDVVRAVR